MELCTYIIHTRLSLVGKIVSDTQDKLICKLADDSVLKVIGMVMLTQLTLALLKCLVGRINSYCDATSKLSFACLNQWNP
jgi:hypothetical protein